MACRRRLFSSRLRPSALRARLRRPSRRNGNDSCAPCRKCGEVDHVAGWCDAPGPQISFLEWSARKTQDELEFWESEMLEQWRLAHIERYDAREAASRALAYAQLAQVNPRVAIPKCWFIGTPESKGRFMRSDKAIRLAKKKEELAQWLERGGMKDWARKIRRDVWSKKIWEDRMRAEEKVFEDLYERTICQIEEADNFADTFKHVKQEADQAAADMAAGEHQCKVQ